VRNFKLNLTVQSKSRKYDKCATTDKKRRICIILDENTREERNEHKYDIASALGMAQIGSANETAGGRRSWYEWPGPGGPEGVPGPDNVACVFAFLGSIIVFAGGGRNFFTGATFGGPADRL
jgi:hypothetical protein